MTRHRLALALVAAGGLLIGAAVALVILFALLDVSGGAESQFGSQGVRSLVVFGLQVLVFYVVGSLLTLRHERNAVGWLCLAIALLWLVNAVCATAGEWAVVTGHVGLASWLGVPGGLWVFAVGLMATHLPLRLPDGRHLSRAWQRYSWFCTAVLVVLGLAVMTAPGPVNGLPGTDNPIGVPALQVLGVSFVLLPLSFLGAIASVVVRYRRSDGAQRQQLRVIAFGALVFLVVFLTSLGNMVGLYPSGGELELFFQDLAILAYTAVPVSILIAVVRYRLYDIDVVINRALVYGALTATLAAAYLAVVLTLQFALRPVTERSDLAVAASTLAVAALFGPARRRIQAFVDRRFYRSRYDAARTLDAFGGRLREQVDLLALGTDLRDVVVTTMHPTHVSLWVAQR